MAFSHGTNAKMSVNSVDVSAYLNTAGLDTETETAEVTTLGKTAKNYIPGLEDGTFSLGGPFDPSIDSTMNALRRTVVPFLYQPQGATAGLPRYSGNCLITSYSIETTTDDAGTWEAEFQLTDGWTRGTNP